MYTGEFCEDKVIFIYLIKPVGSELSVIAKMSNIVNIWPKQQTSFTLSTVI